MENFQKPKLQSLGAEGGLPVTPITVKNLGGSRLHYSPLSKILDPYASDSSRSPSPMMKYLCSAASASNSTDDSAKCRSPLASIESLMTPPRRSSPVFNSPMKIEEDVLVMDGILVGNSNTSGVKGKSSSSSPDFSGSRRSSSNSRSSLSTSGGSRGLKSSSFSSFGGSGSGSGSNDDKKQSVGYKAELCRSWEDSGTCFVGSKCRFAHGKEELWPTHLLRKSKFQDTALKSNSSSGGSSSSSYGSNSGAAHQVKAAVAATQTLSSTEPIPMALPTSPFGVEQTSSSAKTPATATVHQAEAAGTKTLPPNRPTPMTLPTSSPFGFGQASGSGKTPPAKTVHQVKPARPLTLYLTRPTPVALPRPPFGVGQTSVCRKTPPTVLSVSDWTPHDDGIEVTLPSGSSENKNLSREDVDAYVDKILYGKVSGKRLPVFTQLCLE